jgi:hypothetical protein
MLSVPLTDAVSNPRTVMIVCTYTFLAHPAVPCSQWHIYQALSAIPKTDFDFASFLAPLDCSEILFVLDWLHIKALLP